MADLGDPKCSCFTDVFLHELGHLQVVDDRAESQRRRFARETKAQEFAGFWRKQLWSEPFEHPDPVRNPPSESELPADTAELAAEVISADQY